MCLQGSIREWMEQTFQTLAIGRDASMGWRDRSGRYLYRSWVTGYQGILDKLAEQVDPAKTLLYVDTVGRKDDYDVNYPDYTTKT